MKEIKFKLWDKKLELMSRSINIYRINYGKSVEAELNYIPLQYTNLKDKTGKEELYHYDLIVNGSRNNNEPH